LLFCVILTSHEGHIWLLRKSGLVHTYVCIPNILGILTEHNGPEGPVQLLLVQGIYLLKTV
jgi:hypothetical protein